MTGFNLPPGVSELDPHINPPPFEDEVKQIALETGPRYSVVSATVYIHTETGQRVSPYGAAPWTTETDRANWKLTDQGFTVYDSTSNTYGCGRPPWTDKADAQAFADRHNAKHAANRVCHALECWDQYDEVLELTAAALTNQDRN